MPPLQINIVQKVWREIKRPFSRIKEPRVKNNNKRNRNCENFHSELYIREDGRVNISYFEIDIVLGCNLRCTYCSHLSPYRKGFVPTEEIVHWFETWSKKIHCNKIRLVGGEPFLHPDIASVLLESRRIWNNSQLEIVSNGLLINQTSPKVFEVLKKTNISVTISDHSSEDLACEEIMRVCTFLEQNDISYRLSKSNAKWRVFHQLDEYGFPMPFNSSPQDAFAVCTSKLCPALASNRLYKCTILASINEGVREGSLSAASWKGGLTYSPLSPDADATTILEHFRSEDVKECCICPDKIVFVEPTQIQNLNKSVL